MQRRGKCLGFGFWKIQSLDWTMKLNLEKSGKKIYRLVEDGESGKELRELDIGTAWRNLLRTFDEL